MGIRGMQRTWFRGVTDTYLRVPLSYFGRHPTGELLAHADADAERAITVLQPLPVLARRDRARRPVDGEPRR